MRPIFIFIIFFISCFVATAQQPNSTIKGIVIDKHSQFPIMGATVILVGSDPVVGTGTDFDGTFRLENVSVGRHTIQITSLGYKPITLSNLLLQSGRELDLNIQMEESIEELGEVEVIINDKKEAINELATVSARTFSMEEAARYSGSLQDPSRMAQNYAGVSGASDDRNDVIIRGNSPLGVLWRMEGVDIPSPNHFSALGTTGGPISMLNINNLANSDFMTSAWSADYGNALSGVFDLKLRNGNRDTREYLGQVGFNGFELGAEGPFKTGKKASYLANYRYSTLGVFSLLGVDLGTGSAVPNYQDLTFKINAPTEKWGTFTLWGVGGLSDIFFEANPQADSTNLFSENNEEARFKSNTFILGGSHLLFLDDNTFSKLSVSLSSTQTSGSNKEVDFNDDSKLLLVDFDRVQTKISTHYKINRKFNVHNTASIGVIADQYLVDIIDSALVQRANDIVPEDIYATITDVDEGVFIVQPYLNWQNRPNDNLTFNTGLHAQYFHLTESFALEPRLGMKYQLSPKHTLSTGAGLHSQIQPITLYFIEETDAFGNITYPNQELDFSKFIHTVLGHDFSLSKDMRLKTEVYYQYLYNIPVNGDTATSFSIVNEGADFDLPRGTGYVNDGTGYNYGLEFTLEKFYSNQYYFLFTTSLFESKYAGSDGVVRNTLYNGNYVINGLAGKEFTLGKNKTLAFDTKITTAGGRRYTPINFDQSAIVGSEVRYDDRAFELQYAPYFRADVKITYTVNSEKISQKIAVDVQNITDRDNVFITQYNPGSNSLQTQYQRGFFPIVLYQIYF